MKTAKEWGLISYEQVVHYLQLYIIYCLCENSRSKHVDMLYNDCVKVEQTTEQDWHLSVPCILFVVVVSG